MNFRLYIPVSVLLLATPIMVSAQVDRGIPAKVPVKKEAIRQPLIRQDIPSGRRKLVTPPESIDLAAIKRAQIPRAIMDLVAELGDDDFANRASPSEFKLMTWWTATSASLKSWSPFVGYKSSTMNCEKFPSLGE